MLSIFIYIGSPIGSIFLSILLFRLRHETITYTLAARRLKLHSYVKIQHTLFCTLFFYNTKHTAQANKRLTCVNIVVAATIP